jgi:hypothetical protein
MQRVCAWRGREQALRPVTAVGRRGHLCAPEEEGHRGRLSATETEGHRGPLCARRGEPRCIPRPAIVTVPGVRSGPRSRTPTCKLHAHQPYITATSRHPASSQTNAVATAERVHGRPAQRADIGADSAMLRHSEKTYPPDHWCCGRAGFRGSACRVSAL